MSKYMNPRYRAMEAYVPGEQPRDKAYIKLNTNESPFSPAPSVVAAMTAEEVEQLRLYSDPTGKGLKEKLASLYGLKPGNVFLSNGSDEALYFLFLAYGAGGAAFPDITYGFYLVFAELIGIEAIQIPLEPDFTLDHRKCRGLNRLIVIANPNAPTGLSLTVGQIEELLQANPNTVVAMDEAYVDFGGESCYPLLAKYDNLAVVRTFSKSRCMAGARLGYVLAPEALIADLEKLKFSTNPYNVNRLTLRLGEATVEAEAYYREKCAEIIRVREWTAAKLRELGFAVLPSDANFLFVKSHKIGGEALYKALKSRGILVRHFQKERIKDYNRITIGTAGQMAACVKTISEILGECL